MIYTDQVTNFTSLIFQQISERLAIVRNRTTPYHPSANGLVEPMNRSILHMIRCTLNEGQNSWDELLPLLAAAIRSTVNRSTGFTPNFLMLGREVQTPLEVMTGVFCESQSIPQFVRNLTNRFSEAHQIAREHLQENQLRQKRDYDVKLVTSTYNVGDVVMLVNSATKVGQLNKASISLERSFCCGRSPFPCSPSNYFNEEGVGGSS
jgi:hypothetical protein